MPTTNPSDSLPGEIFLMILTLLDYQHLLLCRLICRSVYAIIETSAELQYTIEIAMDGSRRSNSGLLAESPDARLKPYSERIADMRRQRKAWASLDWNITKTVLLNFPVSSYCLDGGYFVVRHGALFRVMNLSAGDGWKTYDLTEGLGFPVRNFFTEPSQDLVIILSWDEKYVDNPGLEADLDKIFSTSSFDRDFRIHLRTLSDFNVHPEARLPFLSFSWLDNGIGQPFYLADHIICVESNKSQILMWNWKLGVKIMEIPYYHFHHDCFSLLDTQSYIIGSFGGTCQILLYRFDEQAGTNELVATLDFPPLGSFIEIEASIMLSGCTTYQDSLVSTLALNWRALHGRGTLAFAVDHRIFRDIMTQLRGQDEQHIPWQSLHIAWEDWGENNTCIIARTMETLQIDQWTQPLGYRVVFLPILTEDPVLRVIDLNVLSHRDVEDVTGVDHVFHQHPKPLRVGIDSMFKPNLEAKHPFHETKREFLHGYQVWFLDGDTLVGIKGPETQGGFDEAVVFTFNSSL